MIRVGTPDDIRQIVELGRAMHAESIHSSLSFDADKCASVLAHLMDYGNGIVLVAEDSSGVFGFFLGVVEEHIFSREKFSSDLATYVLPEKRGGFAAAALLRAYVRWARTHEVHCINGGIASGINHDVSVGLYGAIGFMQTGITMEFQGER